MTGRLSPAAWCLVGALSLSAIAPGAMAQTATVATAAAPVRLLVAHPVVASLTTSLVQGVDGVQKIVKLFEYID